MKQLHHLRSACIPAATIIFATLALIAWSGNPHGGNSRYNRNDTVPEKHKITREPGDRDFDRQLRELDRASEQLRNIESKDWDKINKEMQGALDRIDVEKIRLEKEAMLRKTDLEKMRREIEASLRQVDFEKIRKEMESSLEAASAKIDKEKIKEQLKIAQAQVEKELQNREWEKELEKVKETDMEQMRKDMDEAKKQVEKAKEQIKLNKVDIRKNLEHAGKEVQAAKEELKGYQEMVYDMEKEGLLNTKEDYTIKYSHGDLFINGKQQSQEIAGKYKKYFRKGSVTIKKEEGDLDVNTDDK